MKRVLIALLSLCISCMMAAQELPKLKPLSEKEMNESLVPAQKKDGKWGYVNEKESFKIKAVFEMADPFVETVVNGTTPVVSARVVYGGKYGVLARTGLFLYNPEFDTLSEFDRGVAVFTRNGVYGFLTATGNILAEGLEDMKLFDEYGMAWFKKDGRWGAYDLEGNVVINNEYDKIPDTTWGVFAQLEKDGKLGFIYYPEKKIVLAADCDAFAFDENDDELILCRKGEFVGCFHVAGKQLLPIEYDQITGFKDGQIVVVKGGKFGLYDKTGKMLVAPSMNVNQVAEAQPFYQIFDESTGRQELKVYYKDQLMDVKAFDDLLFQEISKERYSERVEEQFERFPNWMKTHLSEVVPAQQYKAQWRYDKTYYPVYDSIKVAAPDYMIKVGKNLKVIESKGFVLPADKSVSKAKFIEPTAPGDSVAAAISCGTLLQSMFSSVNGGKLSMYDKAMGTDVFRSWKSITAIVREMFLAPDNETVMVIDFLIDDTLLMQRVITKISPLGHQRFAIKLDGILYNQQNYVATTDSKCFATEDKIIFSYVYGKNKDMMTKFHSLDGKLLTELNDFYGELLLETGTTLKFYGRDKASYGLFSINFEKLTFSRYHLEINPEKKLSKVIDGTAHFFDKETMLLENLFDLTSKHMPVLTMRYASSTWDGQSIVGISPNHWGKAEDIKWTYIPRILQGSYNENLNGYMVNVYPVGEGDIAVYGVYPEIWLHEGIRYGYIGYGGDFFTQPYFEEAKPFVDGVAEVKIGGEVKKLRKEDFAKYMTDPKGAFSPENYEVGTNVFTMEHIAKSMSGSGNEVTEDGFWLMRGNGGELIAYLNTYTGKYGFADTAGKMVTAPVFDSYHNISPVADGLIAVRVNDKSNDPNSGWGFIDMAGNLVIPCEYYAQWPTDAISLFTEGPNGVCVISKIMPDGTKKVGCINKKGEILIPFEFDEITGDTTGSLTAKNADGVKQFRLY